MGSGSAGLLATTTIVDGFLESGDAVEVIAGFHVLSLENLRLFDVRQLIDCDVAIDATHATAALELNLFGKALDAARGGVEELVETLAKTGVEGGDDGENMRVVHGESEGFLDLANALDETGIHHLVEVTEVFDVLTEIVELADELAVLGGKGDLGGRAENVAEREFEGRSERGGVI